MANKLLGVRGGELVSKCWAERFITRSDQLEMAFNQAKDRQRILQEDPETISAWFKLVEDTKAKYSVHDDDFSDRVAPDDKAYLLRGTTYPEYTQN
jgi:hypothetical protein